MTGMYRDNITVDLITDDNDIASLRIQTNVENKAEFGEVSHER